MCIHNVAFLQSLIDLILKKHQFHLFKIEALPRTQKKNVYEKELLVFENDIFIYEEGPNEKYRTSDEKVERKGQANS